MVKIDRFWSFYLVWSEHTIHKHHWNRLDKLIPIIYEKLSVNTDNSGRTCFKLREMLCKSTYQIRRNEVPNSNLISQSSLKKVKINSCIQIYNKLDLIKVIKKIEGNQFIQRSEIQKISSRADGFQTQKLLQI